MANPLVRGLLSVARPAVRQPVKKTKPSAIRKIYDDLPKERIADIPEQVDDIGIYGYHGSAKGRLADTPEEYFDIIYLF